MNHAKAVGTRGMRFLIHLLTLALAILIFWLLGFLVRDVKSIEGPDYKLLEERHVDKALVAKADEIGKQIAALDRNLEERREEQRLARDSSQNLQNTINQLVELQKLSLQKDVPFSDAEKENLSSSLARFLQSQENYQNLNRTITGMTAEKSRLAEEERQALQQLDSLKEPAMKEYHNLLRRHRVKLAAIQLVILIPLLALAAYLLVRRRGSLYFPLYLALGAASLFRVALVIHEYFPARLFRYILILALLAAVARILVHLIRSAAFPQKDRLLQQYREAYERFLCPVCQFPIRTGPRRFLFWTRRTVHKVLPASAGPSQDEAYTCPACGTLLYEKCSACGKIRHALLPHCEHCGACKD